jgi:twitching motility protein PilI
MIEEYCRIRVSQLLWIAVPVSCVEEVTQLQPQDISLIPAVNPCLLGITNKRGRLLWILHLEKFLGIKATPLPKQLLTITIRLPKQDAAGISRVACVVVSLEEIVTLDSQKFVPVPDKLPQRARELLSGLVNLDKKTYGILNVEKMFRILNPSGDDEQASINQVIGELAGISTA